MKKILLTLFSCAIIGSAGAQHATPRYSNNFDFGLSYTGGQFRENLMGLDDRTQDYVGLQFNYIGLFHLNQKVAIGAGTGIRHIIAVDDYFDSWEDYDDFDFLDSYFAVPLYAHARFRFLDRRVSPFLSTSIGYQFRIGESTISRYIDGNNVEASSSLSSGLLANVQAGVSIHVGSKFNIMAGPYFEYRQATLRRAVVSSDYPSSWGQASEREMNFFEGGLKVGFAF